MDIGAPSSLAALAASLGYRDLPLAVTDLQSVICSCIVRSIQSEKTGVLAQLEQLKVAMYLMTPGAD